MILARSSLNIFNLGCFCFMHIYQQVESKYKFTSCLQTCHQCAYGYPAHRFMIEIVLQRPHEFRTVCKRRVKRDVWKINHGIRPVLVVIIELVWKPTLLHDCPMVNGLVLYKTHCIMLTLCQNKPSKMNCGGCMST